jgi:t-SNARE complex subunit (syntaxin)
MNEIADMTEKQGAELDIIGDDIFNTKKNVVMARGNMEEANEHHKKSRTKVVVFTGLVLIMTALIITFLVMT